MGGGGREEQRRTAQIRTLNPLNPLLLFLFHISKMTNLMKKFEKGHGRYFPGDFMLYPGDRGDLMKNLETPGKTGRVGRSVTG